MRTTCTSPTVFGTVAFLGGIASTVFGTVAPTAFRAIARKSAKTMLLALVAVISLAACDSKDGDWPPMKWKTEAKMDKAHKIKVPAEGGEYRLRCTNYMPWICDIAETTEGVTVTTRPERDGQHRHLTTRWGEVEIDGHDVRVKVSPSQSAWRMYNVWLTAGDIFCNLYFEQKAEQAAE